MTKLHAPLSHSLCGRVRRRTFLADCGMGFFGLALGSILARDGVVRAEQLAARGQPDFAPKAKRAIYLFMSGAP